MVIYFFSRVITANADDNLNFADNGPYIYLDIMLLFCFLFSNETNR